MNIVEFQTKTTKQNKKKDNNQKLPVMKNLEKLLGHSKTKTFYSKVNKTPYKMVQTPILKNRTLSVYFLNLF